MIKSEARAWSAWVAGASLLMASSAALAQVDGAVVSGFSIDDQGQPVESQERGALIVPVDPDAGVVVPGDSYFVYTDDQSTCESGGQLFMNSSAAWAQLEGTIQTVELNPASDPGGEFIARGPMGDSIVGPALWNAFTATLEADGTAFETIRGRDGATLGDPIIHEVTVTYDCSTVADGDPAVRTYTSSHRSLPSAPLLNSVPSTSLFGLIALAMALLTVGLIVRRQV